MKLGKKPARKDAVKFKLSQYLNLSALPTPPTKAGHQGLIVDWEGMLGNDKYGDCVFAGAGHETILWNKEAGKNVLITEQNALSDYSAVTGFNPNNPSSDQGTDMTEATSYRRKTGIVDSSNNRHKVIAYLAISPGNITQMKQAIYLFSNVGIGFEFPNYAMDEFNAGQSWHLKSGGHIDGGHYVPAIGYNGTYIYTITWGKVQKMTWGFFKKYCDEAVVYISDEFLTGGKSLEGFDLTQLQADLSQLK